MGSKEKVEIEENKCHRYASGTTNAYFGIYHTTDFHMHQILGYFCCIYE